MITMRRLPVKLSPSELQACSDALAGVVQAYDELKDEAKAVAKDLKERLEALGAKRASLASIVERRQEVRAVECREAPNFERNVVEIVRLDTGELVDIRELTAEDRQASFFEEENARVTDLVCEREED